MYYTGIGSRDISKYEFEVMEYIAYWLANFGLPLRSGGANGSDTAFEKGAATFGLDYTIYLPSYSFNMRKASTVQYVDSTKLPSYGEAMALAKSLHPAWYRLKPFVKNLMARNCHQVLGDDLDTPSLFVICCADGSVFDGYTDKLIDVKGGTGQAVRLAARNNIPVYNVRYKRHRELLLSAVENAQNGDTDAIRGLC